MQDFARWIGKLAAAAAAVLAVVWLVEAMPGSRGTAQEAQLRCHGAAVAEANRALSMGHTAGYDAAYRRAAECWRIAASWDEPMITRALLAAGAAVVLLLLTAMVRRGGPG
jgi:hypothetical protein